MTVWLVWTGTYSDADVVGVYSSLALAEAAARLLVEHTTRIQEFEVDAHAQRILAGLSRYHVYLAVADGSVDWINHEGIGTGEPTRVVPLDGLYGSRRPGRRLRVECDARDRDHALKIAGDERARHLALTPQSLSHS